MQNNGSPLGEGEKQGEMTYTEALPQLEQMFSVAEAALLLNIRPNTLYNWISQGRLPRVKVGSKIVLPESTLRGLIREGDDALDVARSARAREAAKKAHSTASDGCVAGFLGERSDSPEPPVPAPA